jgi:hypothetical protein
VEYVEALAVLFSFIAVICSALLLYWIRGNKKVHRYAVTLKRNEGAFIALCTGKRWDYWTFEDIRITPTNPGAAVMQAAPGQLHVPYRNILYYQEIQETANADE